MTTYVTAHNDCRHMSQVVNLHNGAKCVYFYFFVFFVFFHFNSVRMSKKVTIPSDSHFSDIKWLYLCCKVGFFFRGFLNVLGAESYINMQGNRLLVGYCSLCRSANHCPLAMRVLYVSLSTGRKNNTQRAKDSNKLIFQRVESLEMQG